MFATASAEAPLWRSKNVHTHKYAQTTCTCCPCVCSYFSWLSNSVMQDTGWIFVGMGISSIEVIILWYVMMCRLALKFLCLLQSIFIHLFSFSFCGHDCFSHIWSLYVSNQAEEQELRKWVVVLFVSFVAFQFPVEKRISKHVNKTGTYIFENLTDKQQTTITSSSCFVLAEHRSPPSCGSASSSPTWESGLHFWKYTSYRKS